MDDVLGSTQAVFKCLFKRSTCISCHFIDTDATVLRTRLFASTIRYHEGTYYVINVYLWDTSFDGSLLGTLSKTTDPFDSASRSDPIYFTSPDIDCDIF